MGQVTFWECSQARQTKARSTVWHRFRFLGIPLRASSQIDAEKPLNCAAKTGPTVPQHFPEKVILQGLPRAAFPSWEDGSSLWGGRVGVPSSLPSPPLLQAELDTC